MMKVQILCLGFLNDKDFEIPGRLKDVNIEYSDCEMLATEAMKQTRLLPNNPRLVEFDDALIYMLMHCN